MLEQGHLLLGAGQCLSPTLPLLEEQPSHANSFIASFGVSASFWGFFASFGVSAPALGHCFGGWWWFGGGGSAHHPVTPRSCSGVTPQGWAGIGVGVEQDLLPDDDFLLQELFLPVNPGQRCIQSTSLVLLGWSLPHPGLNASLCLMCPHRGS